MIEYVIAQVDMGTPNSRPIAGYGQTSASTLERVILEVGQEAVPMSHPGGGGGSGDEWDRYALDHEAGDLFLRPSLPAASTVGTAPMSLDLSAFPLGASVAVSNEAGDVISLGIASPLTLVDAGSYRLHVSPPWPFLPLDQEIIVA